MKNELLSMFQAHTLNRLSPSESVKSLAENGFFEQLQQIKNYFSHTYEFFRIASRRMSYSLVDTRIVRSQP